MRQSDFRRLYLFVLLLFRQGLMQWRPSQTPYVVEDSLKLLIPLSRPPEYWNYRHTPLCSAWGGGGGTLYGPKGHLIDPVET